MAKGVFVTALVALIATSRTARADGIALSRFEPSERGSRFFLADSLELRATPARPVIAAGVTSTHAYRTRTFGSEAEGVRPRLVEHALYIHPGASAVIMPGARFSLDLPVAAYQHGRDENLNGVAYQTPPSPRLGDLRASFDLHLLGPTSRDEQGIGVAGGVSAWLPTGSTDNFTGDEGARFGVHGAAAARFGVLLASARAGYMYRRDARIGGSRIGSEVDVVLGVAYADDVWTIGPELRAVTLLYDPFATRTTPAELLLGAHRSLGPMRAGLAVGTSIVPGLGAPDLRFAFSLEWLSPAAAPAGAIDRDHDGVPDDEDACPDVAGMKEGPATSRGCPPPAQDLDHDGILDGDDACPDTPGSPSSDPKTHGCPIVPTVPHPDPSDRPRGDPPSPDGPPIQ